MGLRALSGGVDLATFWVPGFNGFPVSDSYDNCLAGMTTTASASPESFMGSEPEISAIDVSTSGESAAVRRSAPAPAEEKPRYTK